MWKEVQRLFIFCFDIVLVWFSVATKNKAKQLYCHTRDMNMQQFLILKITGKKITTEP